MKQIIVNVAIGTVAGVGGFTCGMILSPSNDAPSGSPVHGTVLSNLSMAARHSGADWRNARRSETPIDLGVRDLTISSYQMRDALGRAMAQENPVVRIAEMSQLLANLDESNLDAVLEAYKSLPVRADNKEDYKMFLQAWAHFDGAAAIKYASEELKARGLSAGELRRAAMPGWGASDPEAAVAWLDEKSRADAAEDGKEVQPGDVVKPRADYAAKLIKGWVTKDPEAATAYVKERFGPGKERETLVGIIAANQFKDGVGQAVNWAESLSDPQLKEEAFEELAEDWSSLDPAATGTWLAGHINETYAKEAVEDLARGWAVKDLNAAVGWFETLPDGLTRGTGIYELMKIWTPQDTVASGEWLAALPEGSVSRDMGVSAYAKEMSTDNPEAAAQWLDTIQDHETKVAAAPTVVKNWMRHDPAGAHAWAETSGLIDEETLSKMQVKIEQLNALPVDVPLEAISFGNGFEAAIGR